MDALKGEEAYVMSRKYTDEKAGGGGEITVDSELDKDSKNPVENRAITERLNEVFQSVSNGKEKIAAAITDKGVDTAADDTFDVMADNIGKVQGGSDSTLKNITAYFSSITDTAVNIKFEIAEE